MLTDAVAKNRAYFPRGLHQPEGAFRFSVDALLLAAFITRHCLPLVLRPPAMLELGCGCGVVSFACLLADKGLTAHGVDIVPELTDAAKANAVNLGLEARFSANVADVTLPGAHEIFAPGAYAVVAANPPYRLLGKGRLPRSEIRKKALFADEKTLPGFVRTAARVLGLKGRFALIYPWDTRETLLTALAGAGFSVAVTLPVRTAGEEPGRVLYAAVRGGAEEALLPPLILHTGGSGAYTDEALAFCPWLHLNRGETLV